MRVIFVIAPLIIITNANNNHLDTQKVKKDKQEFTVKMREGDSFLMPQVFDNDDDDGDDDDDDASL